MKNKALYLTVLFLFAIFLGNINQILEISPKDVGASFMAYSTPVET